LVIPGTEEKLVSNKKTDSPLRVVVAGAGTMGHGLAMVMARAGHKTVLFDIRDEALDRALDLIHSHLQLLSEMGRLDSKDIPGIVARITTAKSIEVLSQAEFLIESVSEDPEVKRAFYREAAARCAPGTIVGSNTSYLNIFELAPESLQDHLLINHFYAPPYIIPLVEMVKGPATLPDVMERVKAILSAAGQKPVIMEKFIAGFIVNRLQRAIGREIFHLMDAGYAKPEEIDKAVLASLGVRLPVLGVVRRLDFAGLDFALKIYSNPPIGLMTEEKPSERLKDLVSQGHLGVKTGKGFYDYGGRDLEEISRKRDRLLLRARDLIEEIERDLWSE
jgi:3-hydroxybutyryl-CoA dehydrogenase